MNKDLDGKVKELSSLCMKQKNELSRLSEENERISEQLATYVERPRPQGREANGSSTPEPNGSSHNDVTEDNEWHKKYLAVSEEHEQIIKEKDVILQKLHSAESQLKSQVSKLESDLEDQRAKNNDLRSKNWKTVEALNNVEQKYQNLLKNTSMLKNPNEQKQELESVLKESEESQKQFLQRLFPDIQATNKSHGEWLNEFETEVIKFKESKQEIPAPVVVEAPAAVAVVDDEELKKLEGQVTHYKSVLAETEAMLNQLQASVESEESTWKSKMAKKEAELEQVQRQLESVESKNVALEASMNSLNSVEEHGISGSSSSVITGATEGSSLTGVRFAFQTVESALPLIVEEMETKLRELQEKLALEEADKLQLQTQLHQCLESEEIDELKQKIESETQLRQDLDEKVAKMNQLLATGQEALAQEKKTVELLRQQIGDSPTKTINGGEDEPKDEAAVAAE